MKTDHNLLGLNYREQANLMHSRFQGITDFHTHIHGRGAAHIFAEVAKLYGIEQVFSMTPLEELDSVRAALGDMLKLIAFPIFRGKNPRHDHGAGYLLRIKNYHSEGARIVKFWAAPRGRDFGRDWAEDPELFTLNTKARKDAMALCCELGMDIMVHVADPDTWFQTHYQNSTVYGTKESQYEELSSLIETFPCRWILAHMGGNPEDLSFLNTLLESHSQIYIDTSATKWIVREISKHPTVEVQKFFHRWQDRILFGSDIVTSDDHLNHSDVATSPHGYQANSEEDAFDLYASRYWALRTLWETDFIGKSSIADPDLHLVEPLKYGQNDSPLLKGVSLPQDILVKIYQRNAARFAL